ncbi:hypothetical protein SAMD00019534_010400 [Acytostelium subglobosum LB1]|uniref:hypothetical protein n=1 Tax=Acytostelium subglobosum LB1 TaxID=1410327 RepID=UPI000644AED5|nr:hypothetical protein SAMD00019534_010400 [Acytostelium subglobosum LB1]GAM17865.1 hypothetical protein SAMD00019534_010400 [Acytostelium subglobosum LB1]|eukprot:XP_012758461.1 hypothetical protein SAMD00019534_010400 [Acytostelium subglobosum LB1]
MIVIGRSLLNHRASTSSLRTLTRLLPSLSCRSLTSNYHSNNDDNDSPSVFISTSISQPLRSYSSSSDHVLGDNEGRAISFKETREYLDKETDDDKICLCISILFKKTAHQPWIAKSLINYMLEEHPSKMSVNVINLFIRRYLIDDNLRLVSRTYGLFNYFGLQPNSMTLSLSKQLYGSHMKDFQLSYFNRLDITQCVLEHELQNGKNLDMLTKAAIKMPHTVMANLVVLNHILQNKQVSHFLDSIIEQHYSVEHRQIVCRMMCTVYLHFDAVLPAMLTYLHTVLDLATYPTMRMVRVFLQYSLYRWDQYATETASGAIPPFVGELRHRRNVNYWLNYCRQFQDNTPTPSSSLGAAYTDNELIDPVLMKIIEQNGGRGALFGQASESDVALAGLIDAHYLAENKDKEVAAIIKHLKQHNFRTLTLPHGDLIIQCAELLFNALPADKYFTEFLPSVPEAFKSIFMTSHTLSQVIVDNLEQTVKDYLIKEDMIFLRRSMQTRNDLVVGALMAHDFDLASDLLTALLTNNPLGLLPDTIKLYIRYCIQHHKRPVAIPEIYYQPNQITSTVIQRCCEYHRLYTLIIDGELEPADALLKEVRLHTDIYLYPVGTLLFIKKTAAQDGTPTPITFDRFTNELLPYLQLDLSHTKHHTIYGAIFEELHHNQLLTPEFVRAYIDSQGEQFVMGPVDQRLLCLMLITLPQPIERVVLFNRFSVANNTFSKQVLAEVMKVHMVQQNFDKKIRSIEESQKIKEDADAAKAKEDKSNKETLVPFNGQQLEQIKGFIKKCYDSSGMTIGVHEIPNKPSCKISSSTRAFINRHFLTRLDLRNTE